MSETAWIGMQWGAALLALAFGLAPVLSHWQRRRRVWLTEPAALLESPPTPSIALLVGPLLVFAASLLCIIGARHWSTPLAAFATFCAAVTLLHLHWHAGLAVLSLASGIILTVTIGDQWFWSGGLAGETFGLAIGGLLLVWLARFWHQQLRDGAAWTVAGRLIPYCRPVAMVVAFAALAVVWLERENEGVPVIVRAFVLLGLLGLTAGLTRAARTVGPVWLVGGAAAALAAAGLTAWGFAGSGAPAD